MQPSKKKEEAEPGREVSGEPREKGFQEGGHHEPWIVTCHLRCGVTNTARGALSTVPAVSSRSFLEWNCRVRGRPVLKAPVALLIN